VQPPASFAHARLFKLTWGLFSWLHHEKSVHLANPAGVLFFGYFLFAQAKESNLPASTTPRWINVQCRLLTSGAEHIVVQKYRHMQLTTRRNWRYAD
jgi:hypothetical protein